MARFKMTIVAALAALSASSATGQVRGQTVQQEDGGSALVHEAVVAAPAADVWQAVSTVEGWKTWSVPVAWEVHDTIRLQSGYSGQGLMKSPDRTIWETTFSTANRLGNPNNIRHLIIARVPDRLLVFRTIQAPRRLKGGASLPEVTWLLELVPQGEKTLVRLTGAGFGSSLDSKAAMSFFEHGNEQALKNLQTRFIDGPRRWGSPAPTGTRD